MAVVPEVEGNPIVTQEEHDSARRLMDAVNLHVHAIGREAAGKWVAIRLSDGSSTGDLYDSYRAAVAHITRHDDPHRWIYLVLHPGGMQIKEALLTLISRRQAADKGVHFGEEMPIFPQRLELSSGVRDLLAIARTHPSMIRPARP